jgi:hypothetical protein
MRASRSQGRGSVRTTRLAFGSDICHAVPSSIRSSPPRPRHARATPSPPSPGDDMQPFAPAPRLRPDMWLSLSPHKALVLTAPAVLHRTAAAGRRVPAAGASPTPHAQDHDAVRAALGPGCGDACGWRLTWLDQTMCPHAEWRTSSLPLESRSRKESASLRQPASPLA